jgi:hypothetical protein
MGTECLLCYLGLGLRSWLCVTLGLGLTDFFRSMAIGFRSEISLAKRDLRISRVRSSEPPSAEFSSIFSPNSKLLPPKPCNGPYMKFVAFGLGFGELGSKLITF